MVAIGRRALSFPMLHHEHPGTYLRGLHSVDLRQIAGSFPSMQPHLVNVFNL